MLGYELTCEAGASVCVHVGCFPDPLLTREGPVTFPACALHQLFVRSCDLAQHGLYCSHVCVCAHRSSLQHLPFCVRLCRSSVPTWKNLSACGCLLAPQSGITLTTWATPSQHYTLFNSYKLVRAPRPLCRFFGLHTTVTWCSDFKLYVSCPQVTHSAISPQVQTCPTRTITSELMSATLAEAATQLSLVAFLERCISVSAPRRSRYQPPPHLWMPPRRPFHTSLSLMTFLHNSRSRS